MRGVLKLMCIGNSHFGIHFNVVRFFFIELFNMVLRGLNYTFVTVKLYLNKKHSSMLPISIECSYLTFLTFALKMDGLAAYLSSDIESPSSVRLI